MYSLVCPDCGAPVVVAAGDDWCPECGGYIGDIGGTEINEEVDMLRTGLEPSAASIAGMASKLETLCGYTRPEVMAAIKRRCAVCYTTNTKTGKRHKITVAEVMELVE
jgi:hypothetical protein